MEYMPSPRVWQWSLLRLKRRCKLAPHQALMDLSVIMDEILRDSVIFSGVDQSNLLMKINRSPQVWLRSYLCDCLPSLTFECILGGVSGVYTNQDRLFLFSYRFMLSCTTS